VGDIHERTYWDEYQSAYEDMIGNTATKHAPWHVVPADNKWFTRLVISSVIVDTLESLHLSYPKVDTAKKKELEEGRHVLEAKS
jgi:polyphosphate kinase 2 (PPK2 family)